MAHEFLKAEQIASTGLSLVKNETILPSLVYRDIEANYSGNVGPRGDEVLLPIRGTLGDARELEWRTSQREIVTDDIREGAARIKLDTYLYKSVALLNEEQTLDIEDFGAQVLAPMTSSIVNGAEQRIAKAIADAPYEEEIDLADSERATYNALIDARKFLRQNKVPRDGLVAIAGTEAVARALKDPTLVDVDRSGSDSALRDAAIGRIAGFEIFESDVIDEDSIYLFHPTAFPTVFRAPTPARSFSYSASMASDNVALSYWEAPDIKIGAETAFLGTFFGVNTYEDPVDMREPGDKTHFVRAVRIAGPNADDGSGSDGDDGGSDNGSGGDGDNGSGGGDAQGK